jgi:hypothetical protein
MDNFLEKARTGIYKDNPENRRLNRVGQRYSLEESIEEFRENQVKIQDDYSNFINEIASEFDGVAIVAPPKSLDRLKEKVNEDYKGDFKKAKDILRSTIVVDRDKVQGLMDSFAKRFNNKNKENFAVKAIADFENEGYQGGNFVVEFKGYAVELQVNTPVNIALKDGDAFLQEHPALKNTYQMLKDSGIEVGGGHKYYEKLRSKDTKKEDKPLIEKMMIEYYSKRLAFESEDKIKKSWLSTLRDLFSQPTTFTDLEGNEVSELEMSRNTLKITKGYIDNLLIERERIKEEYNESIQDLSELCKSNQSVALREDAQKQHLEDVLIQSLYDNTQSYNSALEELKIATNEHIDLLKASKIDRTGLIKVKRVITRGGKTFLGTFWVRPDEMDSDFSDKEKIKEVELEADFSDEIMTTRSVSFTSKTGKEITGVIHDLYLYPKDGKTYIYIKTADGKTTGTPLSSVSNFKLLDREDKEPTIKEEVKFDFNKAVKVDNLGGSSGVVLYEQDGAFFTGKPQRDIEDSLDQLKEEILADSIYVAMGFKAPNGELVFNSDTNEYEKVASYIDDAKELGSDRDKAINKEIQKGFLLDCLLANWDVVGSNFDNILVSDGGVVRIDNGGALRFRAKGAPKPLTVNVSEIDLLRDESKNPTSARIFKGITNEELQSQYNDLAANFYKIDELTKHDPSLNTLLKARLENIRGKVASSDSKEIPLVKKRVDEVPIEEPKKEVLRADMPSLATQRYFDSGWDDLELDGNPELKATLKAGIIRKEKNIEGRLRNDARDRGMEYEEYLQFFQDKVDEAVAISDAYIAVHSNDVLEKIISSGGRFKTLFETRTGSGSTDRDSRARTEESLFGFNEDIDYDVENRPVYGYSSSNKNGVINDEGVIPPVNTVHHYGDISFKVKHDVGRKKATITRDDSLGSYFTPSPLAKPHFTTFFKDDPKTLLRKAKEGKLLSDGSYTELQYHGKLSLSDMESVHISLNSVKGGYSGLSDTINKIKDFAVEHGNKDIRLEIFEKS